MSLKSFEVLFVSAVAIYGVHLVLCADNGGSESMVATDDVTTVHIVFMNHLDIGYAGFINQIINEYFQTYFPRAALIGQQLKDDGYAETFIYTTHAWLVALYLDCPENLVLAGIKLMCPNEMQKAQFIDAIKKGFITWHAGPFNLQPEMAHDTWLFEYGISLSKSLDKRLGVDRKTLVFSQRDVPGMTQTVIPSLVKMGVSGISVGVNAMTPPPAVPSLFVWKYKSDSVIATWHAGGYPRPPGPVPANPGGMSKKDCVVIPGFSHVLCFAFRDDNSGPPASIQEVLSNYEIVRAEFPNAVLKASRFEDYFEAAESIRDQLPVITSEIGDTWIEGVASDPRRCAEYRAVSRAMKDCFNAGTCSLSDFRVWNSSWFLLKVPEHTWGMYGIDDFVNWSNEKFHAVQLTKPTMVQCAKSYVEQRAFLYLAIEALQDHPVTKSIENELEKLKAVMPDLRNFVEVTDTSQLFKCNSNSLDIGFGRDGSIVHLGYRGKKFVTSNYPMSKVDYVTYNETDFDAFNKVYQYAGTGGIFKFNLTNNFNASSQRWNATMRVLFRSKVSECEFYAVLTMTDPRAHILYGAPGLILTHYTVKRSGVDIDIQMFNKTSTRLPEALYFTFQVNPLSVKFPRRKFSKDGERIQQWSMSKIGGRQVDPHDVVLNGSQYQHALDDGGVTHLATGIRISSFDLPLVVPMTSGLPVSPFPLPMTPITDDITGFAFNFINNIWQTNYIIWYPYLVEEDANFKARFRIEFGMTGKKRDRGQRMVNVVDWMESSVQNL